MQSNLFLLIISSVFVHSCTKDIEGLEPKQTNTYLDNIGSSNDQDINEDEFTVSNNPLCYGSNGDSYIQIMLSQGNEWTNESLYSTGLEIDGFRVSSAYSIQNTDIIEVVKTNPAGYEDRYKYEIDEQGSIHESKYYSYYEEWRDEKTILPGAFVEGSEWDYGNSVFGPQSGKIMKVDTSFTTPECVYLNVIKVGIFVESTGNTTLWEVRYYKKGLGLLGITPRSGEIKSSLKTVSFNP